VKKILISLIFILVLINNSFANDYSGSTFNWNTGEYNNVDVSFNGSSMEIYNWDTGEYEDHDIESNDGSGTFETYNWSTGEYNTVELD
tara:strand:- start:744 stop:1007 length:264 start_codon:yes stop_codon:yes gene_type:complete